MNAPMTRGYALPVFPYRTLPELAKGARPGGVRGASSRSSCYAQKSLEIFARLGVHGRIREKSVTWSVGRTLIDDEEIYSFDLAGSNMSLQPPFINIQQFYVEWILVDRIAALGLTDLRWRNRVEAVHQDDGRAASVDPTFLPPAEFTSMVSRDFDTWGKVVRDNKTTAN